MKERIAKTYICDFCGKSYSTKDKAIECEQSHSIDERLQLISQQFLNPELSTPLKEAVVCPTCNGKGYYYGNDGCDVRTCYDCNGKGIVISVTEIQRAYKRIGDE